MIIGTGIDLTEIARVEKAARNPRFLKRVFSEREIAYCDSRGAQAAASYAARFAGKEAVLKAFGTGWTGGKLTDIEILPDEKGRPTVCLSGYFERAARQMNLGEIHVSLSHEKLYAVAQVIFWRGSQ